MATDPVDPPDARTIAGLLADPDRRAVVAALSLGAATVEDVREATGLGARAVGTALARLTGAGLVEPEGKGLRLVVEAFAAAARELPATDAGDDLGGLPPEQAKVLRSFMRGGRLLSIPVQPGKRRVVLDRLAQEFEPGRRYREREVNAVLRRWHDDTASLRRYLVDEELLVREASVYWRAGGTFEV